MPDIILPGPAGRIEARYQRQKAPGAPMALVLHPHPQFGGTMNNPLVYDLFHMFHGLGCTTVRFNFRGVGKSAGRFDRGVGETDDLLAIVAWARAQQPSAPLWLMGFSFGAYVAVRALPHTEARGLLLVAPPVTLFDFADLPEIEVPWMVVQGGKDEVISPHAVSQWVHGRSQRPLYAWLAEADHFFHGRLNRLRETVARDWPNLIGT